jgi:hypothetical protein
MPAQCTPLACGSSDEEYDRPTQLTNLSVFGDVPGRLSVVA